MLKNILVIMTYFNVITFILCVTCITTEDTNYYVAAVVEYYSTYNQENTSFSNMLNNLNAYKKLIEEAKHKGADIIVFPEDGITSIHLPSKQNDVLPFTSIVPVKIKDVNPNPCDNEDIKYVVSTIIYEISCEAKKQNIYVVVNLAEKELSTSNDSKWVFYNTDVVFNRKGDIIARYRKYNLFGEPMFNQTLEPELVTFETDFGATFGLFTCFDIVFYNPAVSLVSKKNITDAIFPTAWFSELPFLTAIQMQAGWARSNEVNLLASGYSNINGENGGSGIYSPVCESKVTYVPEDLSTQILISKVPLKKNKESCPIFSNEHHISEIKTTNINFPQLFTKIENLSKYSSEMLTENVYKHKIYHDDSFWCEFTVNYKKNNQILNEGVQYIYRMMAYNGIRYMGSKKRYTQVCGITACSNVNKNSCGYIDYKAKYPPNFPIFFDIEITGNFKLDGEIVIIPSTVNYNLYSLSYNEYIFNKSNSSIKLQKSQKQLMTFGIFTEIW